jgi:uncharacterized protein
MTDAAMPGGLRPQIAETHTGLVILVGDRAYKVKKPVVTDFLDFSDPAARARACADEVTLNRRLAPASYLGVGRFVLGDTEEPVIVMRRHPDERRLATMARSGAQLTGELAAVAARLARFHADARRGPEVDEQARPDAVRARWRENLDELSRYAAGPVPGLDPETVAEISASAGRYLQGRAVLLTKRIAEGRIVDGHADLLADDIFCMPDGPALLDCLEFDAALRYVDVVDDAAFLAMDLEYLGRPDLADRFLAGYLELTGDDAPDSLRRFYIAYRAVVRAKVDCVRYTQGRTESAHDARRHLDIAVDHLRAAAPRMVLVGGAPGTGKTTLARALAEATKAEVISSDDVRADMVRKGEITGSPGTLGEGRYAPGNVDAVYDALLRRAHLALCEGRSVIADATWLADAHRTAARAAARRASCALLELACAAPLDTAVARIAARTATTSEVTPRIATALARPDGAVWPEAIRIDTTRPLPESVNEALRLYRSTR